MLAGEAIFFLPFVIPRVFRPTFLDVFGITNLELGAYFSVYGTVAVVAYLFGGPLADRYPPHRLMTLALGITAAGGLGLATIPDPEGMFWLYGLWGISTILLFWAPMLRATRIIGGGTAQGKAFGILDGGRGLTAAIVGSLAVWLFALLLPSEDLIKPEDQARAFSQVILFFSAIVFSAMLLVSRMLRGLDQGQPSSSKGFDRSKLGRILSMPAVWLQSIIILCAYSGYRVADDYSLLARDILGYDEVKAAGVGTLGLWLRPISAIGAGFLADRISASKVTVLCFMLMILGGVSLAFGPLNTHAAAVVLVTITSTSLGVYGIRGTYFAIMEEGAIPINATGTAVGLASMVGYLPDIYMAPLIGVLLDQNPGLEGHRFVFMSLSVFAFIGLTATLLFRSVTKLVSSLTA